MTLTKRLLLTGVLVCCAGVAALAANAWVNGQNAASVLGQANFTTSTSGSGNSKFNVPLFAVIDPASGKLFVSDVGNNRVLRFASAAAQTDGAAAEAVIGQPDFSTTVCATTAARLCNPYGLTFDSAGRLWVADLGNHRVLRFDDAVTAPTGTATASQVIGQSDFITNTTGAISQSRFAEPSSVAVDAAGTLWVADVDVNRVLRFDAVASKGNGPLADGVLGQSSYITAGSATTQNGFNGPMTVAVMGTRLWVADLNNNRVLRFENAAAKANGANADGVLGQPAFTTSAAATTQAGMNGPFGATPDAVGRLYVGDSNNNRVMIFNSAATLPNGAPASNVLGQPNFTTATAGTTQSKMNFVRTPAVDPGNVNQIYLPEQGNNRVTRWLAAGPTAANVTVSGRVFDARGNGLRGARVTMQDSRGNTISALTNTFGYYSFPEVQSGDTYLLNAVMKGILFAPKVVNVNDSLVGVDIVAAGLR